MEGRKPITASHCAEYTAKAERHQPGPARRRASGAAAAASQFRPAWAASLPRAHGDACPPAPPTPATASWHSDMPASSHHQPCQPASANQRRPEQQRQRRAERHVGAPQAERDGSAGAGGTSRRIRLGAGIDRQQKTEALDRAQHQQQRGSASSRPAAQRAGRRQDQQPRDHAALQAQAVGRRAPRPAPASCRRAAPARAGSRLHQRRRPALAQHRNGRRQLAHVQRRADAGQHDQRCQRRGQACARVRAWDRRSCEQLAAGQPLCSRAAKRSVMPAM